jgi:hypothetical protein
LVYKSGNPGLPFVVYKGKKRCIEKKVKLNDIHVCVSRKKVE